MASYTSILLTDYGLNVANLTFEEAKNIVDKIYFTEGTINPNKTIKELSNLNIGDYYELITIPEHRARQRNLSDSNIQK